MTSNLPNRNERVSTLETRPFSLPKTQGVLELYAKDLKQGSAEVNLQLRFVPLKFALAPESLISYAENILEHLSDELETFAALCLDDLFDTLVPSYLEVIATAKLNDKEIYRCTFHKEQAGFKLPEALKPLFYTA